MARVRILTPEQADERYATGDGGAGPDAVATPEGVGGATLVPPDGVPTPPGGWVFEIQPFSTFLTVPEDFGAVGDGVTDDTAALQAMFDSLPATGGAVVLRNDYLVRSVRPGSNVRMSGGGTIRYRATGSGPFDAAIAFGDLASAGGTTEASNLRNIRIEDLTFVGTGSTTGISENQALLHLSGVSDVLVRGCRFLDMQGDGVMIAATSTANTERRNRNVHIADCLFDGIGNYGRQGVSVIVGEGITIEGCDFANLAAPTMPGAVDIEPNVFDTWGRIGAITVRNNRFRNIGGNVADVVIALQPASFTNGTPRGFTFEGNYHDNSKRCYHVLWNGHDATTADDHMTVKIRGNHAYSPAAAADQFARVFGVRGVDIEGNIVDGFTQGLALVGFDDATTVVDVNINDNTYVTPSGDGVILANSHQRLGVRRNRIIRDGTAIPSMIAMGAGTSSGMVVKGNEAVGVTHLASTYGGHTTNAATNTQSDNNGMVVDPAIFG